MKIKDPLLVVAWSGIAIWVLCVTVIVVISVS